MRKRLVAAVALTLAVAACSSTGSTSPSTPAPSRQAGSATSATSPQTTLSPSSSPHTSFARLPLWPFASVAAAQNWQQSAAPGGHQPWHLDAGEVAVNFARQYLNFAQIDHVVSKTVEAREAHVGVGWTKSGKTGTAAVIHLVRIGSGADQPWEVVGTDDTEGFTLTQPRYGSTVTGTTIVGGHIAGVDESIRVTARQLSGIVGAYCCAPAGAAAPWSVPVRLTQPRPGLITIVASTGGHVAAVERFTITGVHSG